MLHHAYPRTDRQRERLAALWAWIAPHPRPTVHHDHGATASGPALEPSLFTVTAMPRHLSAPQSASELVMTPLNQMPVPIVQPWPLQMGQPLKETRYDQQQSKCNRRQLGLEPLPAQNVQMH